MQLFIFKTESHINGLMSNVLCEIYSSKILLIKNSERISSVKNFPLKTVVEERSENGKYC